ncbi:MAG: sigma-54 dependent transcriptional regulator [Burkholderiales bacterium]
MGSEFLAVAESTPIAPPAQGAHILLVEDEVLFARAAKKRLELAGYRCLTAATLLEAKRLVAISRPDLVLLDLRLPDGNGMDFLAMFGAAAAEDRLAIIVLTAYGEIADAVLAMKSGALDYLRKPIDMDELQLAVDQALQTVRLKHKLDYSRERDSRALESAQMLGDSPVIAKVRAQIGRLASLSANAAGPPPTILILGETGTGKDVAARLLHASNPFRDRPFVQIDCASLPKDLIEAELFGHEKGAYTGAQGARAGLIEAAEEGTLFLDEIGELPLDLQAKLLNVIERRRTRRLGATKESRVGAQFVAGTNRDLPHMIAEGAFRSDLYYRLNVITLTLPPLRERGDDVLLLARHFAAQTCRRYNLPAMNFSEDALLALTRYHWPGNVRELKHQIERALLLSHGDELSSKDLGLDSRDAAPAADAKNTLRGLTLEAAERQLIVEALRDARDNVSEAARRLGVSRMTLRYRMEKYALKGDAD